MLRKTKVAVKITDKNRQKAIDLLLEYGQEFNIADSAEGFLIIARKPYQEKASVWEVIQGEPWELKIINLTKLREILKTEEGEDPYLWGNKIVSEPRDVAAENVFDKVTSSIADLLKYKNEKYGNSALEPMQVFEGKTKVGQRLDDKLARIKNSTELKKNDVADLIGYLTLVCVENDWTDFSEFKD